MCSKYGQLIAAWVTQQPSAWNRCFTRFVGERDDSLTVPLNSKIGEFTIACHSRIAPHPKSNCNIAINLSSWHYSASVRRHRFGDTRSAALTACDTSVSRAYLGRVVDKWDSFVLKRSKSVFPERISRKENLFFLRVFSPKAAVIQDSFVNIVQKTRALWKYFFWAILCVCFFWKSQQLQSVSHSMERALTDALSLQGDKHIYSCFGILCRNTCRSDLWTHICAYPGSSCHLNARNSLNVQLW